MAPSKRPKRRPPLRTVVAAVPHPSLCRGNPYEQDMRDLVMTIHDFDLANTGHMALLRAVRALPSKRTQRRWRRRRGQYGHVRPFRRTGNRRATVLRGMDLLMLAYFRCLFPKALAAEINVLLFNAQVGRGAAHPRFFSPSQITKAEDFLGLSRKRGSTTAYQALLRINIIKRHMFWNQNYPNGIADIAADDMIDIDEAGLFVETANRGHGKAYIGVRVRQEGPYNHSDKYTHTQAISGSANGDRWYELERKDGTTTADFLRFINGILADIGPGTPGNRKCFTMDNLLAHKNPAVVGAILVAGHRIAFRAPYHAVDGPIEYFFNTLQHELTIALPYIRDGADLRNEVNRIIAGTPDFRNYFTSLGF